MRMHRQVKVVGITGSVGKTSTKDMIYSVVSTKYKTLKTLGNYNNHIGLPLTILRLQNEEVMILEMGMNHLGEIEHLTQIALPDVAAITNIGTAHIGELGSREKILQAKMEIVNGLKSDGTLVINDDNDMLHTVNSKNYHMLRVGQNEDCDLKAINVELRLEDSYFDIDYQGQRYHVHVPVSGEHFVYNIKVIDGTYNANLDSMKSSLAVLAQYPKRKIAVLADMLELGEYEQALHEEVGSYVVEKNIDELLCVGEASCYIVEKAQSLGLINAYHFKDNHALMTYLDEMLEPEDTILIKGSNGMHLKEVVEHLKERV